MEACTWRRLLTFGAEGTEAGKFCRPWGVAIVLYSDLSSFSDPWSFHEQEISTTSTSSSETYGEWSKHIGLNDNPYDKTSLNPVVGSNNNRSNSTLTPPWSTYLIGIADRSNNRIQLFNFDSIRKTVTFLHMFGDGPGARHGQFDRPAGLVFNPKLEQIIVTDKDNHRVQVFDMTGTYLFKFGERGNKCGQFCYPWDIDVCKTTHNIIVSDTRNRRVQMFNNLGRYVTHFNQPLDSPRGIAFLSQNQLIVSDFNKHRLLMITQDIEDKFTSLSTTTAPTLMNPRDISYVTSTSQRSVVTHQSIQKLHDYKFIGFGEGSSWGEFLRPQGVTSHGSKIFCADSRNNRVACWSKETQTFSYIGREVVELDRPAGLAAIDNYLMMVDFGNNRVHICQRSNPLDGHPFDTPAQSRMDSCTWRRVVTFGSEGTEAGKFCRPWGIATVRYSDLSNFTDPWSYNEQEISTTSTSSSENYGEWSRHIGLNDNPYDKTLLNPVVGSNNNRSSSTLTPPWSTYLIGIADRSNNRIQLFNFDSIRQTVTFLHMFGDGPGARHGQFDRPAGLVFNPKLEQIIVADKDNHRVQVFDMTGTYLFKFGERGNKCGQFCYPWDIDVCKTTHNIIVSDTRNRRVQIFNNLGRYVTHFNQPLDSPRGITFLSQNQLVVSDFNKHRLLLISQDIEDKFVSLSSTTVPTLMTSRDISYLTPTSQCLTNHQTIQKLHEHKFIGFGEGSSWGEFLRPQGVASHDSRIFCSDSRNNRVACWNKETQSFSYIGRDVVELDRPAGLAAIDNYLVIVDFGNNQVHICQR